MTDCPDPDCCKAFTTELNKVKVCATNKIPKLWGFIFITAFGVSLITGGYKLYSGVQAGEIQHQRNIEAIAQNAEQIHELVKTGQGSEVRQAETRKDIESINKSIANIEKALDRLTDGND